VSDRVIECNCPRLLAFNARPNHWLALVGQHPAHPRALGTCTPPRHAAVSRASCAWDCTRGCHSWFQWIRLMCIESTRAHHTACLRTSPVFTSQGSLRRVSTSAITTRSRSAARREQRCTLVGTRGLLDSMTWYVACCTPVHMPMIISTHCRAHPHHINNYACSLTMHARDWCWTGDCVRKVDACCACAWPARPCTHMTHE
jgi:hypothetical protein